MNAAAICAVMKAHRTSKKIQQATIAKELKLNNANFISMMEGGRSKLPIGRISEMVKAYRFDPDFSLIIVKRLHPEIWEMWKRVSIDNPYFFNELDWGAMESSLDDSFGKLLREYGMNDYADILVGAEKLEKPEKKDLVREPTLKQNMADKVEASVFSKTVASYCLLRKHPEVDMNMVVQAILDAKPTSSTEITKIIREQVGTFSEEAILNSGYGLSRRIMARLESVGAIIRDDKVVTWLQ